MSLSMALRKMLIVCFILAAPFLFGYASAWVAERWSTARYYDACIYGITTTPATTQCTPGWRTYTGFPVKSQFCATQAEANCLYPDPKDSFKEPLYVFGTDFNTTSRFTVNMLFWVFVWLPGIWLGSLLTRWSWQRWRSHPFVERAS